MKFAKIFSVGADDQVLVTRVPEDDSDNPSIVLSTMFDDKVVSFSAVFSLREGETPEDMAARRDNRFEAFNRDDASEFYNAAKLNVMPVDGGVQ